jgi:hypothetical protein
MDFTGPQAIAGRTLALDAVAAEVVRELEREGIRSLVLKGPALKEWLYDGPGERSYRDIDLLVSDLPAAERELRGLGFRFVSEDPHARVWLRGPINLDLHARVAGVRADPVVAFELLSAGAELLDVGRGSVWILPPHGRALHLALHAAQHGPSDDKALEDLRRGISRLPQELWVAAAELAGELDARPSFAAGLALLPQGRTLADVIGLPWREVAGHTGDEVPPVARGLVLLAGSRGFRAKVGFLLQELFPTRTYLRATVPLARRSAFGLLLARAWRPVWLLVRLGPALFGLWRTRRRPRPF